jgi:hypothetical protein
MILLLFCATALAIQTQLFDFCCDDTQCSKNFQLPNCGETYEKARFSKLVGRMFSELHLEEGQVNATDELLLHVMQNYNFCPPNQEFNPNGDCVCKSGKICHFKTASEVGVSSSLSIVLGVIFLLVVLYIFYNNVKRLKALEAQNQPIPNWKKPGIVDQMVPP